MEEVERLGAQEQEDEDCQREEKEATQLGAAFPLERLLAFELALLQQLLVGRMVMAGGWRRHDPRVTRA